MLVVIVMIVVVATSCILRSKHHVFPPTIAHTLQLTCIVITYILSPPRLNGSYLCVHFVFRKTIASQPRRFGYGSRQVTWNTCSSPGHSFTTRVSSIHHLVMMSHLILAGVILFIWSRLRRNKVKGHLHI